MSKKWLIVGGVLVAAIILGVVFIQVALGWVADEVANSGLAGLKIGEVHAGWNRIELSQVSYTPPGSDKVALSADTVSLQPSFLSLFSDTIQVSSVEIEGPYLYVERLPDGSLKLPFPEAETESAPERGEGAEGSGQAGIAVHIDSVQIRSGVGELYDRSVGRPYARFKLTEVNLRAGNVNYPPREGPTDFELSCTLGGEHSASYQAGGWFDIVSQSAQVKLEVHNLDVAQAEPYLREGMTARLKGGTVSSHSVLDMTRGDYTAEGELRLVNLSFKGGGSFLGAPVGVIGGFLVGEELIIPFKIEGNINDKVKFQTKMLQAAKANLPSLVPDVLQAGKKSIIKGIKKLFGK